MKKTLYGCVGILLMCGAMGSYAQNAPAPQAAPPAPPPGPPAPVKRPPIPGGFYGTWLTTGGSPDARQYFFRVKDGKITGTVCGPCGRVSNIWEVEDGQVQGKTATFYLTHEKGEVGTKPGREKITATLSADDSTITVTRAGSKAEVLDRLFKE